MTPPLSSAQAVNAAVKIVPVYPTEAMVQAVIDSPMIVETEVRGDTTIIKKHSDQRYIIDAYMAMIAAAPIATDDRDMVDRSQMVEALTDQRRDLGARHDDTLAELKRVREVAKREITDRDEKIRKAVEVLRRLSPKLDMLSCEEILKIADELTGSQKP